MPRLSRLQVGPRPTPAPAHPSHHWPACRPGRRRRRQAAGRPDRQQPVRPDLAAARRHPGPAAAQPGGGLVGPGRQPDAGGRAGGRVLECPGAGGLAGSKHVRSRPPASRRGAAPEPTARRPRNPTHRTPTPPPAPTSLAAQPCYPPGKGLAPNYFGGSAAYLMFAGGHEREGNAGLAGAMAASGVNDHLPYRCAPAANRGGGGPRGRACVNMQQPGAAALRTFGSPRRAAPDPLRCSRPLTPCLLCRAMPPLLPRSPQQRL